MQILRIDVMKDLAKRTCFLTDFKQFWVEQMQRKINHRWQVFSPGMEIFGLSLRVKQRTSYLPHLIPGHRPGEREELTAVAVGSSMGQVGSDSPQLSAAEKGMVKIQTLHSL